MSEIPAIGPKNLGVTFQKTKDARYHAAERLKRRATWKSALLTLLSTYILLLSAFPRFSGLADASVLGESVEFMTFSASVVLLLLSAYLAFDDDRVRAQGLYDNAWRIGTIYSQYKHEIDKAQRVGQPAPSGDDQYSAYREALESCPFRHDPIDYTSVSITVDRAAGRDVRLRRALYLIRYFLDVYGWPALRVGLPLAGISFIPLLFHVSAGHRT